ncbi:hypothetical protein ACFSTI_32225 [Rhizorhabdus histidinilytica]|jgi:hypothetical protein|nr:hypothetical protein [Novosphingobium naphthalenivorans]EPR15535.1 hypothetical protein M527_24315 [Sphingobium indicum IP26]EQB07465.1 hypothetical protein L286_03850 [Sphingobium sp. HDIP04]EQB19467.1 hypothetical protein RLDS_00170 [Sphingobium lactosutens DS20]PJG45362.1 hypothetical protein CAF53_21620 [Sphingobium sp. LB126]
MTSASIGADDVGRAPRHLGLSPAIIPMPQREISMSAPTHFVHVYATVRVKLGVTAHDQFAAMKEADRLLFANGFGVRLIPSATGVLEADYAEEVSGYLVDEAGDHEYDRSRTYAADGAPIS